MDLGGMDLLQHSGGWSRLLGAGFFPVMADETISFRRSLTPWHRFTLETRIVGYDAIAVSLEQRMVVTSEIYARARRLRARGISANLLSSAQLFS
jgi:acyl-CoA thioesterase FadM